MGKVFVFYHGHFIDINKIEDNGVSLCVWVACKGETLC